MASKIKLTKGKYAIVDSKDFKWLNQWKWLFTGGGYAARAIGTKGEQKFIYMHKIIINCSNKMEVDHKNNEKLDNRRINLREATRSQNCVNRKYFNKTGLRGVQQRSKNSFRATLHIDGKWKSLGHFSSLKIAALAYNQAAIKNFGEFARLNYGF